MALALLFVCLSADTQTGCSHPPRQTTGRAEHSCACTHYSVFKEPAFFSRPSAVRRRQENLPRLREGVLPVKPFAHVCAASRLSRSGQRGWSGPEDKKIAPATSSGSNRPLRPVGASARIRPAVNPNQRGTLKTKKLYDPANGLSTGGHRRPCGVDRSQCSSAGAPGQRRAR